MSKFFFYPVLQTLNDGTVIRKAVAIALQVLGVLSMVGGVYLLIEILKIAFRLPNEGTIGGLLFAIIFAATILSIAQIFWYRANSVRELQNSPFTVIPIVSILFRTIGEVYASLGIAVGIGGCLFIWFAKNSPFWLLGRLGGILPSASPEATFMGGVSFLLYFGVAAFSALVVFYFLAEISVVLVDVAHHVRLLVKQPGTATALVAMPSTRCPACSAENQPGAYFCSSCGAQFASRAVAGA